MRRLGYRRVTGALALRYVERFFVLLHAFKPCAPIRHPPNPQIRCHLSESPGDEGDNRVSRLERVRAGTAHAALVFDGDQGLGWAPSGPKVRQGPMGGSSKFAHSRMGSAHALALSPEVVANERLAPSGATAICSRRSRVAMAFPASSMPRGASQRPGEPVSPRSKSAKAGQDLVGRWRGVVPERVPSVFRTA